MLLHKPVSEVRFRFLVFAKLLLGRLFRLLRNQNSFKKVFFLPFFFFATWARSTVGIFQDWRTTVLTRTNKLTDDTLTILSLEPMRMVTNSIAGH